MTNILNYILIYLKGVCMGIADVIPGVSGGTIAFITGIYEELVNSLHAFDRQSLQLLSSSRLTDFWKKVNGSFLITVFAGITTSLIFLSGLMLYLMKHYPILTWSFFFGVIVMATPLVLRKVKVWTQKTVVGFASGVLLAFLFTISSPVQTPDNLFFAFLAGAIAICAMVVPGISGVFILLLFGKYQYIVTAIQDGNWLIIIVFALGCVSGLVGIARVLAKILHEHHQLMTAVLAGCMVGALNKVWPWRNVLEYATNSKGDQIAVFDKSVLPWHFLSVTGKDPQLFQAIFMMALGILIVVLIEKIAIRLKTKY